MDAARLGEGAQRQGVVLDVRRGDRAGVAVDAQLRRVVGERPEVDDPRVRAVGGGLDRVVEREARAEQEPGTHRRRRLLQLGQLGVGEVLLEGRHDDQIDEHQRRGDDDGQREPQAGADAAQRIHRSRKR